MFGSAPIEICQQVADAINGAKNPVLLLGLSASRPKNTEAIRALLTSQSMPTVGTYQAAGVISRELVDNFVGRVGLFRNQPGDKLLELADVVVTIGYNPVEYDPEVWNEEGDTKIVHIDYHQADIHSDYQPKIELLGDIAMNIRQLTPMLKARKSSSDLQRIQTLTKRAACYYR